MSTPPLNPPPSPYIHAVGSGILRTMSRSIDDNIARAAGVLASASRVLVITGAGMSADSGMPTYRGVGGLYNDRATDDGVAIEQALSGPMFARDPALTWKYLAQIESACRGAEPNAGHRALVALAERVEHLCVITQNVDGLHRAAGTPTLIEMHGNIHRLFCVRCGQAREVGSYAELGSCPPRCTRCQGIERPAVVLFGETLPRSALERYQRELADGFDVVLMVGTTAVFEYIAAPVYAAASGPATAIEINPADTAISGLCDVKCAATAADVLPALVSQLEALAPLDSIRRQARIHEQQQEQERKPYLARRVGEPPAPRGHQPPPRPYHLVHRPLRLG